MTLLYKSDLAHLDILLKMSLIFFDLVGWLKSRFHPRMIKMVTIILLGTIYITPTFSKYPVVCIPTNKYPINYYLQIHFLED